MSSIYKHSDPSIAKVLVGNKVDLEAERKTPKSEALKLANEHGMEYFETSAKENRNIHEVMTYIMDKVYETLYSQSALNNGEDGKKSVVLKKNGAQTSQKEGGEGGGLNMGQCKCQS